MRTKQSTLDELQKGHPHSIPTFRAMDEWAKEFAKWLADNTQTVWEEKITLYRYTDKNNEVGNYTLEDIYFVFDEESKS